MDAMKRIDFDELRTRVERVLLVLGLTPERAALSARLTVETDRDGVRTHGVARLPRFARWVRDGRIDPMAMPERVAEFGAIERWTGHRGPGNLAAHAAMQRAMEIAATHGLGCVALADTSHWMRAGTFGWQAAEAGFAAMCWKQSAGGGDPAQCWRWKLCANCAGYGDEPVQLREFGELQRARG
jgi:3-dehydro-L-gulonate 2-dehydrogenase